MSKNCVWMPSKGKATFVQLKSNFGYERAATIFNKVNGSEFLEEYGDSLAFDSEGVPTYQSIIKNPVVKKYIGEPDILASVNKGMPHLENTAANTGILINKAIELNDNPDYSDYVALVDYDAEGKLTINIVSKTDENMEVAQNQVKIQKLNEKVAEILAPAGVNIGFLSGIEVAAGRVGITNFNHAKEVADGFTGLIQIANNMEGANAISEEFAHLLLGLYQDTPLVKRSISLLTDEQAARKVLGNQYDSVHEFYNGDARMIAEEAAGHLLRDQLLDKVEEPRKVSLVERLANYIKGLFKRFNPGYYQNAIDTASSNLGTIARNIIRNKPEISKEDILKSRRNAAFNALSERAKVQAEKLRAMVENASKASYLQENLEDKPEGQRTEKSKAHITAERMNKAVSTKLGQEETMAAISAYLDIAIADVQDLFDNIQSLDHLSTEDKFRVLKNALYVAQSYGPALTDLRRITTEEYTSDEGIASQRFMYEDRDNSLQEFETDSEVEFVNTLGMSDKEIENRIVADSEDFELSADEEYYINKKTGEKYKRVTSVIDATRDADEPFDKESPFYTPSTNIGTGLDEFVRDFLSGRIVKIGDTWKVEGKDLDEVYPNASKKSLNILAEQLKKFEESQKGITLIPRGVTVNGTIQTRDARQQTHIINVAGTLDVLGYDSEGNWYIYDMKTHRGDKLSETKKNKYSKQLSLYKKFLEDKYGIKIKSLSIIPIKVSYDTPLGWKEGTARYTVSEEKPEEYNGEKSNQLLQDGVPVKDTNPHLEDIIDLTARSVEVDYKKLSGDPTGGLGSGALAVTEGIKALEDLYQSFIARFSEVALPEFVEFLKPFIGENIKIIENKKNWIDRGTEREVSIKKVMEESPEDVSFMQRWFNSLADNPNTVLQIFDKVVKRVKDEKRLKVIAKAQEILALGKEYEDLGITDYSRFFEEDMQRYLCHLVINGKDYSYDMSAYEKSKAAFEKDLDDIYGEHPEVGTDPWKAKNAARERWLKGDETTRGHEIMVRLEDGRIMPIPNPEYYPSKYNSLTETEKEFFEKWLAIKAELDELIGPGHTFLTNSIKIRKNGIERLRSAMSGNLITEFVENAKAKVMKSFDDTQNYASGIRGFTGEEIMKLPLYYINAKGNPSDISSDMIGTLVAYAEMAYNYEAMNEVVNPLEIGKYLVYHNMGIQDTRGNKPLMETFTVGGKTITNPIKISVARSEFAKALEDFFESKIYGRYLKDAGEIGNVDVNKAANMLLKIGSMVQLGFNSFAWMANAATGASMQRIEAAAGEFFNRKELRRADNEFAKAMGHFVGDLGQRIKTSKLQLFDEMFDVRQNYKTNLTHKDFNNRNLLTRIFGPGIQYFGQDAGDHWMYNRTAIAMALRYKLKDKDGSSISLWDALETVPLDAEHPEYGAKIKLKDGVTKEDGSEFTNKDISDLSGRMRYVNQHLFGIYNDEDSVGARRTIVGRFIMQYRDWIPAQFRYRFGTRTTNLEKGGEVEGYYRTTARFMTEIYNELKHGSLNISQLWSELDDYDRRNIVRARTEMLQWVAVCALVFLLKKDKEKDRPWAVRALKYLATRERTELGALVPLSMPVEMINIAKSPFANTSVISDVWNLTMLLNPVNYFDEIQSGDYKGHSSAYRAFMRSPLTLWYRTIKRTAHPEKAEQFYNNR